MPITKTQPKTPRSKKASTKLQESKKYFEAVGRRKTSIARVRIWESQDSSITVNSKNYKDFFSTEDLATISNAPLRKIKMLDNFKVSFITNGGGITGQAEAMRHGVARALVKYDPELRLRLKKSGYLKRDPRAKERKKYGLKKARKSPQWSKR